MSDFAQMPNLDADLTREPEGTPTCPTCGCPVEIVSDEREGTSYYRPDVVRAARDAVEQTDMDGLEDLKLGLLEAVAMINGRLLAERPRGRRKARPQPVASEEWQP